MTTKYVFLTLTFEMESPHLNQIVTQGIETMCYPHIKSGTHPFAMKNTRFVQNHCCCVYHFSCKENEIQNIMLCLLNSPIFVSSFVVWLNQQLWQQL
jgi:hypothetical protein